ncbi:MAG: alpha/beta fold hydrolase [Novosphingobium sp.]|nr:alpha/beta fold hydrolase [Novosphingobium sp.]
MSFENRSIFDFSVTDTPFMDPEFPPEHFMTHFMCEGTPVHTAMWIAQGSGPHPCVIIPPQSYGGDRLESLIIPLLNSGISVLAFQARGMWDGGVRYSPLTGLEDVHAAVAFLRTLETAGRTTKSGRSYRVDPARIGVLGLSGGGGSAGFAACAEIAELNYGIAIAPVNYERFRNLDLANLPKNMFEKVKSETAGRVDSEANLRRMDSAQIDRLSIIHNVPKLLSKTLLLIGGNQDTVNTVAADHKPIVRAFREAGAERFTDTILESDHLFLNTRIALARLVIGWLKSECGF